MLKHNGFWVKQYMLVCSYSEKKLGEKGENERKNLFHKVHVRAAPSSAMDVLKSTRW